jgi:hypothetical protein
MSGVGMAADVRMRLVRAYPLSCMFLAIVITLAFLLLMEGPQ